MGQQLAKQIAEEEEMMRVYELRTLIPQAYREVAMLQAPALAEKARGLPATPGSQQAQYKAAFRYWKMLCAEQQAIFRHWNSQNTENPVPTPARTPPFCPPALPQQAESSALSSGHAEEVEPGTPNTVGSSQRGQHGGSSGGSGGGDDAAPAGDTERLESAPLLGGGSSQLAAVLRRRQGQARV